MELMGGLQNLIPKSPVASTSVGRGEVAPNDSSSNFKNELGQFSEKNKNANLTKETAAAPSRKNGQELGQEMNRGQVGRPPHPARAIQRQESQQTAWDDQSPVVKSPNGVVEPKKSPQEETVDSLTRRVAIQSFMKKMNEKLGIDPTEVVDAFSKLSMEELTRPPEENIEKIIGYLQLSPGDQQVARDLFNEMLAQSSSNSLAEYLKSTDRQLSLSVMSQRESQKRHLASSLDKMNSQFFTQPNPSQKVQPQNENMSAGAGFYPEAGSSEKSSVIQPLAGIAAGITGAGVATSGDASSVAGQTSDLTSQSSHFTGQPSSMTAQPQLQKQMAPPTTSAQPSVANPWNAQSSEGGVPLGEGWASSNEVIDQQQMQKAFSESLKPMQKQSFSHLGREAYGLSRPSQPVNMNMAEGGYMPSGHLGGGMEPTPWAKGTDLGGQQTFDQGMANNGSQGAPSGLQALDASSSDGGDEFAEYTAYEADGDSSTKAASTTATQSGEVKNVSTPGQFAINATPNQGEEAANVRELVNQATFLVKKGGGEMKVSLNPEGLGQVNMKVAVQDGQVNVEMVTESSDAKKLIEKGLGDLKATLASHKLNVDNVRVDFSGEIAKQFDHAHDEAQRQAAQNFMEQFRQENNSWRQGLFDFGGPGFSGEKKGNEEESPMNIEATSKSRDKSRRLNLVA